MLNQIPFTKQLFIIDRILVMAFYLLQLDLHLLYIFYIVFNYLEILSLFLI